MIEATYRNRAQQLRAVVREQRAHSIGAAYLEEGAGFGFFTYGRRAGIQSAQDWEAIRALQARYCRLVHYVREIAPGWETTGRTYWADNSIELTQTARDGRVRYVLEAAPSGDRCF